MKDMKQFFFTSSVQALSINRIHITFSSEKQGKRITRSIKNLVAKRMEPCPINLHESCNLTASISKKFRKIALRTSFS